MHGAHVLMESDHSKVPESTDTMYLLPLCKEHDTYCDLGAYGTGYYMKLNRPMIHI